MQTFNQHLLSPFEADSPALLSKRSTYLPEVQQIVDDPVITRTLLHLKSLQERIFAAFAVLFEKDVHLGLAVSQEVDSLPRRHSPQ